MRWIVCALALLVALPAAAEPRRIVSLDYCADQFVLALADRAQIVALSRGALRDDSYFRARAGGIPQTRGTLEEVLALRPDLVVRNWGGAWNAAEIYGRFGVPVLQIGDAPTFEQAAADLRRAGIAFGHRDRGERLARDMERRLTALRAAPPTYAPVLYMSAGGAVAGSGALLDAMISAAGGRNVRREPGWAVLPLERMIDTPPALIALGFFDHRRTAVNAWLPGRHPTVRRALAQSDTVTLPAAAISCEAWYGIDAAETLARALRSL